MVFIYSLNYQNKLKSLFFLKEGHTCYLFLEASFFF